MMMVFTNLPIGLSLSRIGITNTMPFPHRLTDALVAHLRLREQRFHHQPRVKLRSAFAKLGVQLGRMLTPECTVTFADAVSKVFKQGRRFAAQQDISLFPRRLQ